MFFFEWYIDNKKSATLICKSLLGEGTGQRSVPLKYLSLMFK